MQAQSLSPAPGASVPGPGGPPPRKALVYLAHTVEGLSMRAISRQLGVAPSTVQRQVRRVEERRDDPLYDEAMVGLDASVGAGLRPTSLLKEPGPMQTAPKTLPSGDREARVQREARRILRRLSESHAFLAVAPDMELAVVFREPSPGLRRQTATVEREIAREFALRDWMACRRSGKVACYEITSAGRAALERMLAEDAIQRREAQGLSEARTPFAMQHQEDALRTVMARDGSRPEEIRVNAAESPLAWLARRTGPGGESFLSRRELEAGERLREDFERAEMGPRITQNWERFLAPGLGGGTQAQRGPAEGPAAARERVARAVKALGAGLSDIALRCCCFLEGLETAEKRLGWSKRSGKVVLKIALQRLADHYGLAPDLRG
jgi:hypothetical protein